jgi:hypothetical protein
MLLCGWFYPSWIGFNSNASRYISISRAFILIISRQQGLLLETFRENIAAKVLCVAVFIMIQHPADIGTGIMPFGVTIITIIVIDRIIDKRGYGRNRIDPAGSLGRRGRDYKKNGDQECGKFEIHGSIT